MTHLDLINSTGGWENHAWGNFTTNVTTTTNYHLCIARSLAGPGWAVFKGVHYPAVISTLSWGNISANNPEISHLNETISAFSPTG